MAEYRARGRRRLASATYASNCVGCIWGAEMAVEMISDQWNPSKRRYRRETRVAFTEVAALDATARGEGGFGHTGR